jgi:hypothetical protein
MAGGGRSGRVSGGGHEETAPYSVQGWGLEKTAGQWARSSQLTVARDGDDRDFRTKEGTLGSEGLCFGGLCSSAPARASYSRG